METIQNYRSYLRLLARLQMDRRLTPRLDESDIVQMTMIQAHQAFDGFEGTSEAQLVAWLKRILARNLSHATRDMQRDKRDIRREQRVETGIGETSFRIEAWLKSDDSSPGEKAIRNEQLIRLAEAIETLPEEQRRAVELHYWKGCSLAEVAEDLDKSISAVGGLIHRGLKGLRKQLRASR